tara:strand:+ start:404 stop:691 length:288 start_codon:yes stop_codon:yes gene_type:complete
MNQQDRKEFEIVHLKIDDLRNDIIELKQSMKEAHDKTDESLRFIKENLFNPNEGLWAETKLNTQFRESANRWRSVIGVGFATLAIERVWSFITGG